MKKERKVEAGWHKDREAERQTYKKRELHNEQ